MYTALAWGEGAPIELHIWTLAERFGWTLEYIEALPLARWHEFLQIEDGRMHAANSTNNKRGKRR